jgi:hypothetical protein
LGRRRYSHSEPFSSKPDTSLAQRTHDTLLLLRDLYWLLCHGLPCSILTPAKTVSLSCFASMASEPRHRHPLPRPVSQHAVPEPQPAHTRRSDADTESDNEREATELRSVSSFQQSGRQNLRILSSSSAISTTSHWYDPVRRFWRHCVRITVPHDDCRDHLGKACVLCRAC